MNATSNLVRVVLALFLILSMGLLFNSCKKTDEKSQQEAITAKLFVSPLSDDRLDQLADLMLASDLSPNVREEVKNAFKSLSPDDQL